MMDNRPLIGVTMGDAAGTGPEIIAKGLMAKEITAGCRVVVIGDAGVMRAATGITGSPLRIRGIKAIEEAAFAAGVIDVIDLQNIDLTRLTRGRVDPMAGKAAYEYIKMAAELAMAGKIEAIATSAINKDALNKAGYHYPGHTELLAELCQVKDVVMMLVSGHLRVMHVTTHVSLEQAIGLVTPERILILLKITDDALRQLGLTRRLIAVAGLNPHAGEDGLFGDEELKVIAPAVATAKQRGFNVIGPLPPDSIFFRAAQGEFDAAVAMYHDQGHIAVKMLGIDEGVNVTLGLPIIRTSVEHGTAFDKAGKGTASPKSLIEAIKLAGIMSRNRRAAA
jgi:4-hydroxythreonine-4-phosphate dehydrogenase